jgi:hypothetical protein
MKICYVPRRFNSSSEKLLTIINAIVTEYREAGYTLTVRQMYYQLVARDKIANNIREYDRIQSLINDARLAGLIDWSAFEDRTRSFITRSRWRDGKHILQSAASSFHMDLWKTQKTRVFVLVEKEALSGVLEPVCEEYDIPLLAARGYPSASVLHAFAIGDLVECIEAGQEVLILHLGDHDPSGIDMTRDLEDRLTLFLGGGNLCLRRIALNMDQVEKYRPPENPAKTTDCRFESYRKKFGNMSWELDALKPETLDSLVRAHADEVIDMRKWKARHREIEDTRKELTKIAEKFGMPPKPARR